MHVEMLSFTSLAFQFECKVMNGFPFYFSSSFSHNSAIRWKVEVECGKIFLLLFCASREKGKRSESMQIKVIISKMVIALCVCVSVVRRHAIWLILTHNYRLHAHDITELVGNEIIVPNNWAAEKKTKAVIAIHICIIVYECIHHLIHQAMFGRSSPCSSSMSKPVHERLRSRWIIENKWYIPPAIKCQSVRIHHMFNLYLHFCLYMAAHTTHAGLYI